MTVYLHPRRILRRLLLLAMFISLISLIGEYALTFRDDIYLRWLSLFNVDRGHISTWYTFAILLGCSALTLIIAFSGEEDHPGWLGLGLGFVSLSANELFAFHDRLIYRLNAGLFGRPGYESYYLWITVAILLAGLGFTHFLLQQTPETRRHFLIAALLYIGGGLGLQLLGELAATTYGPANLLVFALNSIEEFYEMAGLSTMLTALLEHIGGYYGGFIISLTEDTRQ